MGGGESKKCSFCSCLLLLSPPMAVSGSPQAGWPLRLGNTGEACLVVWPPVPQPLPSAPQTGRSQGPPPPPSLYAQRGRGHSGGDTHGSSFPFPFGGATSAGSQGSPVGRVDGAGLEGHQPVLGGAQVRCWVPPLLAALPAAPQARAVVRGSSGGHLTLAFPPCSPSLKGHPACRLSCQLK